MAAARLVPMKREALAVVFWPNKEIKANKPICTASIPKENPGKKESYRVLLRIKFDPQTANKVQATACLRLCR